MLICHGRIKDRHDILWGPRHEHVLHRTDPVERDVCCRMTQICAARLTLQDDRHVRLPCLGKVFGLSPDKCLPLPIHKNITIVPIEVKERRDNRHDMKADLFRDTCLRRRSFCIQDGQGEVHHGDGFEQIVPILSMYMNQLVGV